MKSPMLLWRAIAKDLGDRCRVCTTRDFETVSRRSEHEGLSFLTITLPRFGKDFDEALSQGAVAHAHFAGFQRKGGLPQFLGGFLELVFRRSDGVLFDVPNLSAIVAIRQLTRLCSKVALPCSYDRERYALEQYIETDKELAVSVDAWTEDNILQFTRLSRILFGQVFSRMDNFHAAGKLIPKHGPGSTADRLLGNEKYDQREWTKRLEEGGFHSVDFILPNPRFWMNLEGVKFLSPGEERPVKVTPVPKTLETPRIIAIEPVCMQYAQQAVAEKLVYLLETSSVCGNFVGFSDQEPNRQMAKRASVDGSLATLDLSEASDRVSNQLVVYLLRGYTHLLDAVAACRSTQADVPGFGLHNLTKFASMGSALTFPVEAVIFTTIVFVGIENAIGRRLSWRDIQSFRDRVRIYGDDIIVPVEYAHSVMEALDLFGFKVNHHKSFWNGKFRESCGKEYFRGHDVSVVKLREIAPSSLRDVKEIVSWVDFRNQLYAAGFTSSVDDIDSRLSKILKGYFPRVGPDSPLLGRVNLDGSFDIHSQDSKTHQPLAKGWKVFADPPKNQISGEGALLKYFLKRGSLPTADKKHLQRSGRPRVVGIKLSKGPIR